MTSFNLTELLYIEENSYRDSYLKSKVVKKLNYDLHNIVSSLIGSYELAKEELINFLNFEGSIDFQEEEFIQIQLDELVENYILNNKYTYKMDNNHNNIMDIMIMNTYYDFTRDELINTYYQLHNHSNYIIRELFEGIGLFLGMYNERAKIKIAKVNQEKFCMEASRASSNGAEIFACLKPLDILAHELTHLFMNLLFNNKQKPFIYKQDNNYNKIQFHQAIMDCVKKISQSEVVDFSFNLSEYDDYQSINSMLNSELGRNNIKNASEVEGISGTAKTFIERFSYAVNRYDNQISESEFIAISVELLASNIDKDLANLLEPISDYWQNCISPIINELKIQNKEHCEALQDSCTFAGKVCLNNLSPFYNCVDLSY
jgi:hypothetical protein